MIKNPYKVRLQSYAHGRSTSPRQEVVFDVMPTITESHAVDYQSYDPIHAPGSYNVYRGTKSVQFEIAAKLISRTNSEATQNQAKLNILRGWTRSYFGFGTSSAGNKGSRDVIQTDYFKPDQQGRIWPLTREDLTKVLITEAGNRARQLEQAGVFTRANTVQNLVTQNNVLSNEQLTSDQSLVAQARAALGRMNEQQVANTFGLKRVETVTGQEEYDEGSAMLGAPPDVVYLTAYSDASDTQGILNRGTNITKIPCVIGSVTVNWPNDVDYIPTAEGQPFPIVMDISISLTESHSPREFEQFDLYKYRKGILPGF